MPKRHPDLDQNSEFTQQKLQSLLKQDEGGDKRGNRIRRVLETKRQPPVHQQMDIEPAEGGNSLLHDDFGMPKVSKAPEEKLPPLKELPSIPISIKASTPDDNESQRTQGIPQRGYPSKAAQQTLKPEEDDGFIPPRSNFVNVGQKEHAWYDEKVAGPSETIDNNDEVDIDSLQGLNPMVDTKSDYASDLRQSFKKRLDHIYRGIITELQAVPALEELEDFKTNVFGQRGVFVSILKQFNEFSPDERTVLGDIVNTFIDNLKLELDGKYQELISSEDEDEEPFDEEGYDSLQEEENYEAVEKPTAKVSTTLQPGQYGVLVDDKLFVVVDTNAEARNVLSRLMLGNNVAVDRIQLIKRIPIDFGVVVAEE